MDNELFELCKEAYEQFPEWDNKSSTPYNLRLKVWRRGYSISEMGEGNDAYETTPPNERNKVEVYDWEVKEDARHMITTGQEVFKWWYSEVKTLENDIIPLYTSDYLLDKLPNEIDSYTIGVVWDNLTDSWRGEYGNDRLHVVHSDTPLKALLKLTLSLAKAGEL